MLALIVAPANADDRELFRSQNKSPYLFILLDTSGSMNWGLESSNDDTHYQLTPTARPPFRATPTIRILAPTRRSRRSTT